MKNPIGLALVLLGFLASACASTGPSATEKNQQKTSPAVSPTSSGTQTHYGFDAETIQGELFSSQSVIGKKPLFITFWATWCDPCKQELMKLKSLYPQYEGKLEIVAVATDSEDSADEVRSYAIEKNFPFPVIADYNGDISSLFIPGGITVPYSVLIDTNGKIVAIHKGYEPGDEVKIEEEFNHAINAQ